VVIILVIDRLVECSFLRKALEVVYAAVLPKGSYPFIYMRCVRSALSGTGWLAVCWL